MNVRLALILGALSCSLIACGGAQPAAQQPEPSEAPVVADPDDKLVADAIKRGEAAIKAGNYQEAKELFTGALDRRPRHPRATYYLALCEEKLGNRAAALSRYAEALRLDSSLSEAAINLAALLIEDGQFDQARQHLQTALKQSPSDAALRTNLGVALAAENDLEGAVAQYRLALKLSQDPELRLQVAALLADAGKKAEAIDVFGKIAAETRSDATTIATAADYLGKLGAYQRCVQAFDRAITISASPELHVRRGVCRHHNNDDDGARADFESAIKADSKYAPAYYYLGEHLLMTGRKAEALKAFETCVSLAPDTVVGKRAKQRAAEAKNKR